MILLHKNLPFRFNYGLNWRCNSLFKKGGYGMRKKMLLLLAAMFVVSSFSAALASAASSDNGYRVLSDRETGTVKPR